MFKIWSHYGCHSVPWYVRSYGEKIYIPWQRVYVLSWVLYTWHRVTWNQVFRSGSKLLVISIASQRVHLQLLKAWLFKPCKTRREQNSFYRLCAPIKNPKTFKFTYIELVLKMVCLQIRGNAFSLCLNNWLYNFLMSMRTHNYTNDIWTCMCSQSIFRLTTMSSNRIQISVLCSWSIFRYHQICTKYRT